VKIRERKEQRAESRDRGRRSAERRERQVFHQGGKRTAETAQDKRARGQEFKGARGQGGKRTIMHREVLCEGGPHVF
jgi:hypothetical protein